MDLLRLPKTQHMQGSGLPEKFEGRASFARLKGHLIVEEKLDGRGLALGFNQAGDFILGCRGVSYSQRQELDSNAQAAWDYLQPHLTELYLALTDRYVLYGEWLYHKHYLYYDQLPTYFFESDIYDRVSEQFLTLKSRTKLLADTSIPQVPILWQGEANLMPEPIDLLTQSIFQSNNWRESLDQEIKKLGLPNARVWQATDMSDTMEGLYLRTETKEQVAGRFKYVRASFIRNISSLPHWSWQGIHNNLLA
jgi:hypothetical protein